MKTKTLILATLLAFTFSPTYANEPAESNLLEKLATSDDPLTDERLTEAAEKTTEISITFEVSNKNKEQDPEVWKRHVANAIKFYKFCIMSDPEVSAFDEMIECLKLIGPHGTIKFTAG